MKAATASWRIIRPLCILAVTLFTILQLKAQERCPTFLVEKNPRGLHYSLKKASPYRYQELPPQGLAVFLGAYANSSPYGLSLKGDVHLLEYGWSLGWEASSSYFKVLQGSPNTWRTDVFAATFSKYFLFGKRGLMAVGPLYGFLLNNQTADRQYFGAQATLSIRTRKDLWLSGKIQYKSIDQPLKFKVGIATLLW